MIKNLIKIRFLQIFRELSYIGLFRAMFLLIIIVPFVAIFLYQRLAIYPYNYIITGVTLSLILLIQRRRKDFQFIFKISQKPAITYWIEYLVFTTPLIILYLLTKQFWLLILFCSLLLIISFIIPKLKVNKPYNKIIKFIPNGFFEWQSGFRKNIIIIIPAYLLGFLGLYEISFSAVSLFLLTIIFVSFYSEYEPGKILEAGETGASKFINNKIYNHLRSYILFILPVCLLSLVHYELWSYIIISVFASVNLVLFAIVLKYSYYYPNSFSNAHQMITAFVCLFSVILPLAVIVLALNILLYNKARNNLNNYLYAYN